jgi:hypothetical protein
MGYLEDRRKWSQFGKDPVPKKRYNIPNKSQKKIAQEKAEKELQKPDEDSLMEVWHKARRKEATGWCKCGCGNKSQKNDNEYFRHSNCHVFPKRIFTSIKLHKRNCIELAYFGGCHTNMDERSIERWPNMECWDEIKQIFHELSPLLTEKERATKFYSNFETIVKNN